jgi:micrococcal nuclease
MNRSRKSSRRWRNLATLGAALAALSLYQYFDEGEVAWIEELRSSLGDYAGRPSAGWRKASDKFNDLVPPEGADGTFDIRGRVVRVADADTVSVLDGQNKQHKIRLFGVDAPELDQPHGRAAKSALSRLVSGKAVGIVSRDKDQYDRTLGVLYVDGVNVNLELVRAGNAWWYEHYAGFDHDLEAAQKDAQRNRRGLWGKSDPISPRNWRRGKRQ